MNMISTGAFLNEMDASNKQLKLAKKFAAVWEKKNAKAARAGGVSLMALSLAACGGSSSTTSTTTDTSTDTSTDTTTVDTTPAGSSYTLTTVSAGDQFALTAGNDTVTGTSSTYNAADTILDTTTTDADVMNLAVTGDLSATPTVTNVETINITHSGFTAGSTNATEFEVDVANVTGATTFNFTQDATTSVNQIDISNLATGQTVNTAIATTTISAADDNAAISVGSTASSATATSTVAVTSAGALTSLTVNETTGHVDLNVTTGDLDGSLTVTSAQDADVDADAATSATVTAGRDVTITDLTAATSVTITAGRDVADAGNDLLDGATSVTITAGREIDGVDMDAATTVTLSAAGVDASSTGGAERESSITGDAMTTLNVSGNGGAVEYDITGANADGLKTINVTGDQSVTLTTDAAELDSLTKLDLNDSTTAGTTTLVLGGSTPDGAINLSTVDESVIIRMDVNEASGDAITLPANSNMVFNAAQTSLALTAASATAASNTANLSVDKAGTAATTYALTSLTTTNIKTVNLDLSKDTADTTIGTLNVGAANNLNITYGANDITSVTALTAGTLTMTGSGDLTFANNAAISSLDATAVTGDISITALTGDVIQTGSGDDTTTAGQIAVNISTGAGSDTHNLSTDLTGVSSYVLDMGTGTTDTLNVANGSNTNSANVSLTGFNKIVLAGDATMRDTQLSGITSSVFGGSNSVLTIGINQATNDFSGLSVDTATMSTADSDGFVMDASARTSSAVTITGTGFDDTIKASANSIYSSDTITAGGGADAIFVTQGGDIIDGGAGTDTLNLTLIDDAFTNIEGGTSDATGIIVNMSASAIASGTVAAAMGTSYMSASDASLAAGEFGYLFATNAAANSSVVGTVTKVENITGTTGADYLVGTTGANTISAGGGADVIIGGIGGDTITGGAGNDTITLGASAADTLTFSGSTAATNGQDTIGTFQTGDIYDLSGVLTGGAFVNATNTTTKAITLASTADLEDHATSIAVTGGEVYIAEVTLKAEIDSIADIVTALGDGGVMDAVDTSAGSESILIVGGADDDTTHYIYGINTTAGGSTVLESEIALLAVVTTDITNGVDGLLTTNFTLT